MVGGIDKLCQQVAERAATRTRMQFDTYNLEVESPIERLFVFGLMALLDGGSDYAPLCRLGMSAGDVVPPPALVERLAEWGTVHIQLQRTELDWRADFVLSCPSISARKIIVECDGHDFHERTKEQAARDRARDRAAQAAGYVLLRYTGSELYRDPLGCAESAVKLLRDRAWGDWLGASSK